MATFHSYSEIPRSRMTPDMARSPMRPLGLTQVTNNALKLCTKLRDMGSNVPAVRAATTKVAEGIQYHWRVLDTLLQRLTSKDSVHNEKALALVQAIVASTNRLFDIISKATPNKSCEGVATQILAKQRLKSFCRKMDLDTMLKHLNFLSSTTQLLVITLTIGEKIRWSRAFARGGASNKVVYETLRLQNAPAKWCLANQVLLASKASPKGDRDVAALSPDLLTRCRYDMSEDRENWDEKRYCLEHMRIWWDVLLDEWTRI